MEDASEFYRFFLTHVLTVRFAQFNSMNIYFRVLALTLPSSFGILTLCGLDQSEGDRRGETIPVLIYLEPGSTR